MAITKYSDFVNNLGKTQIDGVKRQFISPPASLSESDLPASWTAIPTGEELTMTFQTHGGWPLLRAELVVALAPVGKNEIRYNYQDTLDMLDNLSTALRGVEVLHLGKAHITWTIRQGVFPVAGNDYWVVIAAVEGHG